MSVFFINDAVVTVIFVLITSYRDILLTLVNHHDPLTALPTIIIMVDIIWQAMHEE